MIETIPNLPPPLIGVRVTAKVTAEDYETVLMPAVETAIKEHGSVRILYVLECGIKDFSAGALWDDAKLGLSHLRDFKRFALVTDDPLVRATLRAFHFVMPRRFEIFHAGEDAAAIEWLATS